MRRNGAPALSGRAEAYERFCQQVLRAHLLPGQFVSQRELVERLDMPLGAVREMIPRLEAAGLLVTVPKRGLQITQINLKLIRNSFQVRSMVEREAVANFARTASHLELEEIEQAHRQMLHRAQEAQTDAALDGDAMALDWQLHDRMVDAMGNEILSEMYRVNSLHVRMIVLDSAQVRPMRVLPAMQEHLRFIAALRARDEPHAVQMMLEHIENSRQRVLSAALDRGAAPLRPSPVRSQEDHP